MSIKKYGTVTITEEEIKIEHFYFEYEGYEDAMKSAIQWAIERCEEQLRGEPLKQS